MTAIPEIVCLYILMRNDLASLGAGGKSCAQATHAANQCVYEGRRKPDADLHEMLGQWEQETGVGFGTCIVLSVNEAQMRWIVELSGKHGHHAGITHDPGYPLRDGATTHHIPLDTCGYVFGRKPMLEPFLGDLDLMP